MARRKDTKLRPLWTCPQCQRKFAKAKQWHSCGKFTVEQYLDGKTPEIVALFDRLVELVKKCGLVIVAPTKSMVLFKARTSFAEVKAKKDRLDVHVAFPKRVANPRFTRVKVPWPGCIVHSFHVEEIEQLDNEVAGWLKQAYAANLEKTCREPVQHFVLWTSISTVTDSLTRLMASTAVRFIAHASVTGGAG